MGDLPVTIAKLESIIMTFTTTINALTAQATRLTTYVNNNNNNNNNGNNQNRGVMTKGVLKQLPMISGHL